jgi:hypothetical protein
MKKTVNFYDFRNAFEQLRPNSFSYKAIPVLWEYFEEYEESTGTEIELDVIAICCDYTEGHIDDVLKDYELDSIEELEEETIVLPIPDTDRIIYLTY